MRKQKAESEHKRKRTEKENKKDPDVRHGQQKEAGSVVVQSYYIQLGNGGAMGPRVAGEMFLSTGRAREIAGCTLYFAEVVSWITVCC